MFVSIATTTLYEASFPLRFLGDDLTFKATRVDGPWNSKHGWSKAETPDKAFDDATSGVAITGFPSISIKGQPWKVTQFVAKQNGELLHSHQTLPLLQEVHYLLGCTSIQRPWHCPVRLPCLIAAFWISRCSGNATNRCCKMRVFYLYMSYVIICPFMDPLESIWCVSLTFACLLVISYWTVPPTNRKCRLEILHCNVVDQYHRFILPKVMSLMLRSTVPTYRCWLLRVHVKNTWISYYRNQKCILYIYDSCHSRTPCSNNSFTGHLSALWKVRSEDAAGVEALEGSTKQLEGSLFWTGNTSTKGGKWRNSCSYLRRVACTKI